MKLRFLGGAGEVGRSAVLVDDRLLLDCGILTGTPQRFPLGLTGGGPDLDPEAVVVGHAHLDHAGAVPALLSGDARPEIHWTPPTRELALVLARDTLKLHGVPASGASGSSRRWKRRGGSYDCPFTREELRRVHEVSVAHGYRESFEAAGYEVTFLDAGHIPGSAHVLVDDGETRLLYTGDFSAADQRLVNASTARPDADVVVTESTYSDVSRADRASLEERFVERVETTVWDGGTVVVPAFAIGRTQELLMVCEAHGIDPYVDGMGTEVTRILERYPGFLRDPEAYRRAVSRARFVTGRDGQRRRIADGNEVVVTTAGMLSGGPAMTYVPEIAGDPTNLVALTGYQVEGTPGRELLDTGRAELDGRVMPVSARVERFDFSAHADREGLLDFLDSYRDAEVLVVHGDRCEAFAGELGDEGLAASAPENGSVHAV